MNFNWGEGVPGPGVQAENFSVRWTGFVQPVVTGAHVFSTSADDGVRLWVNDQLVIDNWVNQAETARNSAPISLVANQFYAIRMEFYDHEEDAIARLRWSYPGQAQITIPQTQLYLPTGAPNQPPTVNAGVDRAVTLPNTLTLTGTASDDALPNPPATLTTTWSQVSGPGTVTFGNANALTTTVSFSAAGSYVLRLTASDTVLSTTDDVTVTVSASNQAPTVNAGVDSAVTLPNTVSLAGSATDDGLPTPPGTLTTTWSSERAGRGDVRQSECADYHCQLQRRRHLRAATDGVRQRSLRDR